MEGYLTESQVLEQLKISRSTLYRLRKDKKLAFYHVGRKYLYKPEDVDEYIKKSRIGAEGNESTN